MLTVNELVTFEQNVSRMYEEGLIRAPVHLRSGNEEQLIEVFSEIRSDDYCYCTWASHLQALLKGVPPDKVVAAILEGRSITLNFPEYNFYSSAIVGGIGPIATGTAWAIKNKGDDNRVYCFLGDMALRHGTVHESICYAIGHDLPITFIVEDNGVSVCTDTQETCGVKTIDLCSLYFDLMSANECILCDMKYYEYENGFPHAGIGKFLEF
jgi:TPP-dependent pyruvate/acetoin dehydrogenase alpha subunit